MRIFLKWKVFLEKWSILKKVNFRVDDQGLTTYMSTGRLEVRMHVVHFAQFNFLFLIPANPHYMLPKLGQDSTQLCTYSTRD